MTDKGPRSHKNGTFWKPVKNVTDKGHRSHENGTFFTICDLAAQESLISGMAISSASKEAKQGKVSWLRSTDFFSSFIFKTHPRWFSIVSSLPLCVKFDLSFPGSSHFKKRIFWAKWLMPFELHYWFKCNMISHLSEPFHHRWVKKSVFRSRQISNHLSESCKLTVTSQLACQITFCLKTVRPFDWK